MMSSGSNANNGLMYNTASENLFKSGVAVMSGVNRDYPTSAMTI
jgi:hypothetical protein